MWQGILFDDLSSDISELAHDADLWTLRPAPEDLIPQLDDGIDAGEHG